GIRAGLCLSFVSPPPRGGGGGGCAGARGGGGGGGGFAAPPDVHDLGRVLVDVLDAPVRDGRRLHRGHQVAPAQRRARRVEFLVGRLVMLQRVHLAEVVATGDLAEPRDQRLGGVAGVGVLLRERRRLLDLVGRAPGREIPL